MYKILLTAAAVSIALSGCDISEDHHGTGKATNTVGVVTIAGEVDGMLQATGFSDANGTTEVEASGSQTYQWYDATDISNLIPIEGQTSDSYYVDVIGDAGKDILVRVSYTDDAGYAENPGAKMSIPGDKLGYILVDGCAGVGETLTATVQDGDGVESVDQDALVFTWNTVSGEVTGRTYTLQDADLGSVITVSADYTDDVGFEATAEGETDEVADGESCAPVAFTNMARLLDTNIGGTKNDNGELRYKTSSSDYVTAGSLSATLIKQPDTDTTIGDGESITNTVYFAAYGEGSSSSGALVAEIALTDDGLVKYRDASKSQVTIVDADGNDVTFTDGEAIDVTLDWDASGYKVILDGTTYPATGNYTAISTGTAVGLFTAKIGTSSDVSQYELFVDDIELRDNATGTVTFSDNFDDDPKYVVDFELNGTDDPYNNNSAEATIQKVGVDMALVTDDYEAYTAGDFIDDANPLYTARSGKGDSHPIDDTTIVARVVNDATLAFDAKSGSNVLELLDNSSDTKPIVSREFTDGEAIRGSVSMSVYMKDGSEKGYINIGTSDSGSSSKRYTEIIFGGSEIKFRNASGSQKAVLDYTHDEWIDVTVSWDGTDVTLTVNGTDYTATKEGDPLIAENDGTPTLVAIYTGDNGSTGHYIYIDDLDSELFDE